MLPRLTRRLVPLFISALLGALLLVIPAGAAGGPPPSVKIQQCRNGSAASPVDCKGGAWVTANAGSSNSHYVEGFSMPYRAIMSELPLNAPITLRIEYDTTHGADQHAIDFLTHYNRLQSHAGFGHAAEAVDPIDGVTGVSPTVGTYAIPEPSSAGSPMAGQPTVAFNALPTAERQMTLFGGTITDMAYASQDNVSASGAKTVVSVTFTVDSSTAVMAWGGHIARQTDWGAGNSAAGISGSPYHMRLDSWTLGNGSVGNQDLSFSVNDPSPVAELTVTKIVVNDNGGTAVVSDFPLFVSGTAVTSGDRSVFASGSYTVSETTRTGYTPEITGDCASDGSITLTPGQVASCTITNDDQPATLKVTKIVVNDNGGTAVVADFPLFVGGTSVTSGATNTFNAGSYTVSETTRTGYTPEITGDCASDGSITLTPGQVASCTITNDDQPATLKVTKIVVNDNGGTAVVADFPLFVGGTSVTSGATNTFNAGSYTVSETTRTGYTPEITGDCASDGSITLTPGRVASCTITNDDVAPVGGDTETDPDPTDSDTTDPVVETEVDSVSETAGDNPTPPLQTVPAQVPALPATIPASGSAPVLSPAAELPRTGAAGLREETLLALVLMLAGLSARALGRRRSVPADV